MTQKQPLALSRVKLVLFPVSIDRGRQRVVAHPFILPTKKRKTLADWLTGEVPEVRNTNKSREPRVNVKT